MDDELLKALSEHEPTKEEGLEFWRSVREQEEKFRETTRKLTPSIEDRNRYFNL
tara:strand:+ start:36741 stop:36902 length:162 start_codon:yes stop_codon:yes gene_type:complete